MARAFYSMGIKIYTGSSDFSKMLSKLAENQDYQYINKIDKFVGPAIESSDEVTLCLSHRRTGKTLNQDTLRFFLEQDLNELPGNEQDRFNALLNEANLNETLIKKEQGKNIVLFISFADVKQEVFSISNGKPGALEHVKNLIAGIFDKHNYLLDSIKLSELDKKQFKQVLLCEDISQLGRSFKLLSECIYKATGKRPWILIDEYDTPLATAYRHGYYNEMLSFMQSFLGSALKDNSYLKKAMLTGILRVSQEDLLSTLNNLTVWSPLSKYNPFAEAFGFTENDMNRLFNKAKYPIETQKAFKDWYDGYTLSGRDDVNRMGKQVVLYNPWSTAQTINTLYQNVDDFESHWGETANIQLISNLLPYSSDDFRKKLSTLMSNHKYNLEMKTQGNSKMKYALVNISEGTSYKALSTKKSDYENLTDGIIWGLLLFAGYLSCSGPYGKVAGERKVFIPNQEIFGEFVKILKNWPIEKNILLNEAFPVKLLLNLEIEKFQKQLMLFLQKVPSHYDLSTTKPAEKDFHNIVLGMFSTLSFGAEYEVISNGLQNGNRPDIVLKPYNPKLKAFVLEFKVCSTSGQLEKKAQEALTQIKNNEYDDFSTVGKEYEGPVHLIGVALGPNKEIHVLHEEKSNDIVNEL
jgi:hypothetical protein